MPLARFEGLLEDDLLAVRAEALHALCVHGDGDSRQRLQEALTSSALTLRAAAVGCIAEYGTEDEQSLIDEETVRALLADAEQDEPTLMQEARLLAKIYDPSRAWVVELVEELAVSPYAGVVRQRIDSLGEVGDESHLP
jgi:HEAT repeat protein